MNPNKLSKNFIAAELASKQRELQKKMLLCANHAEPIRFFCDTCQNNICASCIIDHSGHTFIKQDHSLALLKQRINKLKDQLTERLGELTRVKELLENTKLSMKKKKDYELTRLEDEFKCLGEKIQLRREHLRKDLEATFEEESNIFVHDVHEKEEVLKKLVEIMEVVKGLTTILGIVLD
jgi:hypothetical protein